ncbi:MAG: hypothetical protein AAF721_38630 [Myxococcota bacterium]
MRAKTLALCALFATACSHEVPGTSGFAEGGGGEGTPSAGDDVGGVTDGATGGSPGGDADDADGDDGADGGDADGPTSGADAADDATAGDGPDGGDAPGDGTASDDGDDATDGDGDGSGDAAETGDDSGAVELDPCGFPLDGPWLEIEYDQAGVPATSPSWTYSNTPGWGEAEWASQGESWPEVWDVYQNIDVDNDPIGVVATVGSSGTWQLMLGLQDLVDYDSASVCVEGRSVSAVASVQFDVYNPLNDCGGSAMMAHDWNMHAEGVDLGTCFVAGGGVQAVRIEASGGSSALGIKRVRVVLHGAVF